MYIIFPVSIELWKISCMMDTNSLCNICRTLGLNLSGSALCGFKPTLSVSVLSAVMLMSVMFGWELGWNCRLTPELCKSCNDFWARGFKLIRVWGLNTV